MAATDANALLRRAVNLLHAGEIHESQRLCRQVYAADRNDHRAAAILGQIATMQSRHQEAVSLLSRCVKLAPREIDYHVLLAEALATQGRYREAISRYDKVLLLKAGYPAAVAGKANALSRNRQWPQARALLDPFVEAGTEDAGMAVVYARLAVHDGDCPRAVEVASRHVEDQVGDEIRRSLWFDIGRAHERDGDYDRAFEAYTRGNRVRPGRWDPTAAARRHDRIMSVFTPESVRELGDSGNQSQLAVFIVGMPRSGSTLIEQIIDAHPQAFGAGEILALPDLVGLLAERIGSTLPFPECAGDLEHQDMQVLAKTYLDQLRALAPGATRVCDKHLGNYQFLGLIALLFPNARVVHARRDPLDTCLSCFVQKFAPGTPAYTEDLGNLGLAFNDYLALMAHWRQVLGDRMLEIDYEAMIEDQQGVSQRIIDYLGLPWDDRCLRFYETKRAATTLSHEQVARPIYRGSLGRHRYFERHLGPLREVLEQGLRAV